jgi:protein TonB
MIDLAPLAVAPPAPPVETAPGPQVTESQPVPTPDVENPVEDAPPDPAPPTIAETVEPETPDPTPPEPVNPIEEAKPVPPAPTPDVNVPELPKKEEAEAVLEAPVPQPRPKHHAKPPSKHREARKRPVHRDRREVRRTTAPPSLEARRSDEAAAPSSGESSTPSVSPSTWKSELMARLNRYKRYPSDASGAGTASVAFTIDRSGRVLSSQLIRSSGDGALDREAVALPRRASPLPPPPPNIGGGRAITLAVPIRFSR